MAKAYTTSTASIKVPVVLSFTCPKCGQHGTVNKTALLSAQATVRGYDSSGAGFAAQQNLAASAGSQMNFLVERLEKGQLNTLLDDRGRSPSKYVACPHCGIRQVVDVEPRKTLYPRLFALRLIGLFFALAIAFGLVMALTYGRSQVSPGVVMIGEWVSILAVVAGVLVNRSKSKKAYSDPALMEKRYRSVLNSHMEATLMLGIGSVRHVDIPKKG